MICLSSWLSYTKYDAAAAPTTHPNSGFTLRVLILTRLDTLPNQNEYPPVS